VDNGYKSLMKIKSIKAWTDVKSPRFLIWMAIQDIVVIESEMNPVISPTNHSSTQTCDKRIYVASRPILLKNI
jgi:hypothetical protein